LKQILLCKQKIILHFLQSANCQMKKSMLYYRRKPRRYSPMNTWSPLWDTKVKEDYPMNNTYMKRLEI